MKSIVKMLVLGIVFISSVGYINIYERKGNMDSKCLEVIGVALNENNEVIDGAEVKLLRKSEEMEWIEITNVPHHDHNFKFVLDVNEYYTIEISKPGFVNRSIFISTHLPATISLKPIFTYVFEVTLFKDKKGVDDYYLDFPVALVGYNKETEVFDNSKNYTYHIKNKIKAEYDKAKVENMINGKY